MSDSPSVRRSELLAALERICEHLPEEIEPESDLYWVISEGAPNPHLDPQVTMGSVADDIQSVRDMLTRPDGEVHVWHDLSHLAGLLSVIAAEDLL